MWCFIFMKRHIFLLIILLLCGITVYCQESRHDGVFKSKDDFVNHHYSDSSKPVFINLKGELVLVSEGHHQYLQPWQIFGFEKGNSFYRSFVDRRGFFSRTGFYKIEDQHDIIVYSQPGIYKTSRKTFYYFSNTIDSRIYRLTARNLKRFKHPAFKKLNSDVFL
jgi:hypothetical protein